MLFEFRVYWKGVVWPTRYGFVADDFNSADDQLRNQIKEDSFEDAYVVERIDFIE